MYYAELGYKTGYASFVNGLIAGDRHDRARTDRLHRQAAARDAADDGARVLRDQVQPQPARVHRNPRGDRRHPEHGRVPQGRGHVPGDHLRRLADSHQGGDDRHPPARARLHRSRRDGVDRDHRLHPVHRAQPRHDPRHHLVGARGRLHAYVRRRPADDGRAAASTRSRRRTTGGRTSRSRCSSGSRCTPAGRRRRCGRSRRAARRSASGSFRGPASSFSAAA